MSAAIWYFQRAVALRARIPTWAAVSPASCGPPAGPTRDAGVKKPDTVVSRKTQSGKARLQSQIGTTHRSLHRLHCKSHGSEGNLGDDLRLGRRAPG
jgi:hypothetical protein